MKTTYRLLKFKTKFVAYLALLCVLFYVVAGRIMLAFVPDYRLDLQDYLSQELETPVEIDQLVGKWSGFDPIIEVRGLSINGAANAHVKTAQIRFDVVNTLRTQTPRIRLIRLDTVNLSLEQSERGDWSLAGLDVSDFTSDEQSEDQEIAIEDVLDGADLKLLDVFVRVNSPNENERVWRLPSANLSYGDGRVFAQGNVIRPDGLQPLLRFVYNSSQFNFDDRVYGELYVEVRSSDFLDRYLKAYTWRGITLDELDASGRAWIRLTGLSVDSIYADLQVAQLNWRLESKSLAPIVQSAVSFRWSGGNGGDSDQRIDLYDLKYNWRGDECHVPGALVSSNEQRTEVAISSLDIGCASDLLVSLGFIEGRLQQRLEVGDPQGQLQNIAFRLDDVLPGGFSAEAQLDKVAINAFDGAPLLRGVNGYLYTDANKGFIEFDSDNFELYFPDLYLKSWQSSEARGRVDWWGDGRDFMVESNGLYLKLFENSEVFGDFTLRLNDDEHEDYLGLMLGMKNIALPNVDEFVPFYAVDRDLYQWLSDSLTDGVVEEGMYFAYGSIDTDTPDNSFSSSLNLRSADAVLRYDPAWPELQNLGIDLALHEDRLEIIAKDALIEGSKVSELNVFMPSTTGAKPIPELRVQADLAFSDQQYDYWLADSPVSEATQDLNALLSFSGPSTGKLDLLLNLDEELSTDFALALTLDGVTAKHREGDVSAENIRGLLNISSDQGVVAEQLEMELLGEPARLTVHSRDQVNATEISLVGVVDIQNLVPDGWSYGLSGKTPFRAALEVPYDGELDTQLRVSSDLVGLGSTWPAPLGKLASAQNSAELFATFKQNQTHYKVRLNGSVLPKLDSELLFIDEQFEYGKIALSSVTESLDLNGYMYAGDGLGIDAVVRHANVENWVNYIAKEIPASEGDAQLNWLKEINVRADRVDLYDNTIRTVDARIVPDSAETRIELSGETAEGEVRIPRGDGPLRIDLSKLMLEGDADPETASELDSTSVLVSDSDPVSESANKPGQAEEIDPRVIPAMIVSVKDFHQGKKFWGDWSFWTEQDDLGLIFRDLKGQVSGAQFSGQLTWQHEQGHSHTILTLNGEGGNVEPILALFGQEAPITSDDFNTELAIVWPAAPYDFALADVSGSANMQFSEGVIRTDAGGTGILRLFGIFSLDALARRLRLDFSDLYESGITYDSIAMSAVMDQGNLRFVEPLVIRGPSSNYELRGGVDLDEQTLDLKMLVQLPLSSNVPLAGLALGNPALGGAVWLVDKMLGEPLSKLSTIRYGLTGPWADPQVELERAINAK